MTINRRVAIRRLAILSVGTAFLPSCLQHGARPAVTLKNLTVNGDQAKLLEELTAALIPSDETPGAREISAHLFVLKMVDDCMSKADQEKFMKGLSAFDAVSGASSGKAFAEASAEQRAALLAAVEGGKGPGGKDGELGFFYTAVKRLTIQAYTSSQFYLTKVQVYELVPGRFHGCVPVKGQPVAA
jgi:hypothetical protein